MSFVICLASAPVAAQTPALPDEPRYRVELIVLMHLDHGEEARRMRWLEDYSAALDLLAPEPEGEDPDAVEGLTMDGEPAAPPEAGAASAIDPAASTDAAAAGDGSEAGDAALAEEAAADPLGGVVHVPELGGQMQDAWRRLRLSGPFRPLQYLAWEQGASAPFPLLRVHDEVLVLVQDPWAEERAALEAAAAITDEPVIPASGDDAAAGLAEDGEDTGLPPPIQYFRLDGTAQLTRSRFLHLALALEWREPLYGLAGDPVNDPSLAGAPPPPANPPSNYPPSGVPADGDALPPPPPDAFDIHRLEQTRQVRLRRMEYFDGPVLGVLAWITRVSASTGEEDPATDEAELAWLE
ncbi:MAG: CsiV family protein [Xanthomonadales bacterium]|nr:CsiV family protein [Xanthomonadales bacterium]